MSQRQQLERIFEIDRQIRARSYPNADKLAQDLECSRRAVFNDREFMVERLDAPIEFDRERGGWYYTDSTWELPSIPVDEGELLAFLLSIEVAQRHLGTALESSLRSAIEKISRRLKGPVAVDLGALRSHYSGRTDHCHHPGAGFVGSASSDPGTTAGTDQILYQQARRVERAHHQSASPVQ